MNAEILLTRLRRMLLVLSGFIFVGTIIELILEQHTKEQLQFVPFVLCLIGLVSVWVVLFRPHRRTIQGSRLAMMLVAAGSLLGMTIHLVNNYQFEVDIRPGAAMSELIVKALMGASPIFAPGILALAAILVALATYYHPALKPRNG